MLLQGADLIVKGKQTFVAFFDFLNQLSSLRFNTNSLVNLVLALCLLACIFGLGREKSSDLQCFNQIGDFERQILFFSQVFEACFLFVFEQTNAFNIAFNHCSLLLCLSDFIVVGGYTSNAIEHLPALFSSHLSKSSYVALQHNIVAVGTGIRRT